MDSDHTATLKSFLSALLAAVVLPGCATSKPDLMRAQTHLEEMESFFLVNVLPSGAS